ncbi:MAG: nucleotidyltransferase domain-containing protein [Lachnospiraceae bacterium]
MVDIQKWLDLFCAELKKVFGNRIWFVGLQGSYGRNEATEASDIDVVVILDVLQPQDITRYREMLETLSHREKICGFLSGKAELQRWEPADLFQFYYDTAPILGSLDGLLPKIDRTAVRRSIHSGVCNIYHACVHNSVHERSAEILKGLYKSARFVIQAICFLQTGSYCKEKAFLQQSVSPTERHILETENELKTNPAVTEKQFDKYTEILFLWAQKQITDTDFHTNML